MRRTSHSSNSSSFNSMNSNKNNLLDESFSSGIDNLARKLSRAISNGKNSKQPIRKVRFARKKVKVPISVIVYTPEETKASFYQLNEYEDMRTEARELSALSTTIIGDPQHADLESSYASARIMAATIDSAAELASILEQETVLNNSRGLGAWACCEGGTYRGFEECASLKCGLERREGVIHARNIVLQFSKQQSTRRKSRVSGRVPSSASSDTNEKAAETARLYHEASLSSLIFARMIAEADRTAAL